MNDFSLLEPAFVNPFIEATIRTFQLQCRTPVTAMKPYLKTGALPGISIASVISLSSKFYSGSIILCFPENVFLTIYENIFERRQTSLTVEVQDAAGELLNILYGAAKSELNRKGYDFHMAFPTVLVAEDLQIRQPGGRPAIVVPFETHFGKFHIEFEIKDGVSDV